MIKITNIDTNKSNIVLGAANLVLNLVLINGNQLGVASLYTNIYTNTHAYISSSLGQVKKLLRVHLQNLYNA